MALIVPKNNTNVTACTFTEANGKIPMSSIITGFMNKESKIQP